MTRIFGYELHYIDILSSGFPLHSKPKLAFCAPSSGLVLGTNIFVVGLWASFGLRSSSVRLLSSNEDLALFFVFRPVSLVVCQFRFRFVDVSFLTSSWLRRLYTPSVALSYPRFVFFRTYCTSFCLFACSPSLAKMVLLCSSPRLGKTAVHPNGTNFRRILHLDIVAKMRNLVEQGSYKQRPEW